MVKRSLTVLLLIFFQTCFASDEQQKFQNMLDQWRVKNHVVGADLIIQSPEINGSFYSGYRSKVGKVPIDADTLFGVGSITKTIVSTVVLKLESEQKLSIKDPIQKYFPEFKKWKNVTIENLLNMTAGIPNFSELNEVKKDDNRKWTPTELIQLAYEKNIDFPTGEKWHYSNTNYLIVGKIIEKVTHQKISDAIEKYIHSPLKLKHTFFSETKYPEQIIRMLSRGYYNQKDMTLLSPSNSGAAGSMLMNADDIQTFVDHLFIKKDLLPKKQLDEMLQTVDIEYTTVRPENSKFGLGIFTTDDKKLGKMIWYTGTIQQGFTSIFLYIPKKNSLIVAQSNTWNDHNFNMLFPNAELVRNVINQLP